MSSSVFLDTVGLLALWDQRDQWHSAAAHAFDRLQQRGVILLTTDLVLSTKPPTPRRASHIVGGSHRFGGSS